MYNTRMISLRSARTGETSLRLLLGFTRLVPPLVVRYLPPVPTMDTLQPLPLPRKHARVRSPVHGLCCYS